MSLRAEHLFLSCARNAVLDSMYLQEPQACGSCVAGQADFSCKELAEPERADEAFNRFAK